MFVRALKRKGKERRAADQNFSLNDRSVRYSLAAQNPLTKWLEGEGKRKKRGGRGRTERGFKDLSVAPLRSIRPTNDLY